MKTVVKDTFYVLTILLLLFWSLILITGCSHTDYKAIIAAETGYASVSAPAVPVAPDLPDDVCPDCEGDGVVGDGTVMVTCKTCGGSGRRNDTGSEHKPASSEVPGHGPQPLAPAPYIRQRCEQQRPVIDFLRRVFR